MSYNVLDVARYIINSGRKNDILISNLKLQKILYFIQASFLVEKNEPCFVQKIEAWDFGPVVPEVYHEFKRYGSGAIPYLSEYIDFSEGLWEAKTKKYNENIIQDDDKRLINEMVEECSKYTASQLVEITHNQSPWKESYIKGFNSIISNRSIKKYFIED